MKSRYPRLHRATCHFCKVDRETCALVYLRLEGRATAYAALAVPACLPCRNDRRGKWRYKQ